MKTKTLAIGLFPDRIDVILLSGTHAVSARRVRIALDGDPELWQKQVRDAAKPVHAAAVELGALGVQTHVIYRGPTMCAEYASPRAANAGEARSAAMLSCADSLSCPLDAASCNATMIAFDKQGAESRGHLIVAADADAALTAICEMVEAAGLKFRSAVPVDAVYMASAAMQTLERTGPAVATVYFGEYRSFLAVAADHRLVFARPIAVGIDSLAMSLTRPIRLASGQTVELPSDAARAIIHAHGIPIRSQIVHESLGITGAHIVPMLQPVLQRFMVELRQSMRFALPEQLRNRADILLVGPGAHLTGLSQLMTDELGWSIALDPEDQPCDATDPLSEGSDLMRALTVPRIVKELSLEPVRLSQSRRVKRLQRWLWTGAAASLAVIAADAVRLHARASDVASQVQTFKTRSQGEAALIATAERLASARVAMQKVDAMVMAETGARVHMGAVLQELSRITPPSIRLHGITFKPGSGMIVGSLNGYAITENGDQVQASMLLESYMQQLSQSPLLERLMLANAQMTSIDARQAQAFEIGFEAIAVPVATAPVRAARADSSVLPREHTP